MPSHRPNQPRQHDGINPTVKAKPPPAIQLHLNRHRRSRRTLAWLGSGSHLVWRGHLDWQKDRRRRQDPFLLQLMPPRVDLLARNFMALRNLCHRRPVSPNRHDDLELLIITPPTPTFLPKNFDTHPIPRLKHVANDVVKDMS
ncbi:hypothetical protein HNQ96_006286 [Aminobacter lissarensis]|uniref:Uncharacterized protein n=1 Tax=Aminobacter carboxidus TaxID=376165 RepID=A0A8E1WKV1_9HYPH|nr:hypothetical protein [Aminobacter lissarensis]